MQSDRNFRSQPSTNSRILIHSPDNHPERYTINHGSGKRLGTKYRLSIIVMIHSYF